MTQIQKTLGQLRAKYAYDKVKSVSPSNQKEYKSFVKGFSTMVMNNGLGQALAFAKKKNIDFYKHINGWFKNSENKFITIEKVDILEEIINKPSDTYRLLTEETLALVNWFRKFVDSELKTDDEAQ